MVEEQDDILDPTSEISQDIETCRETFRETVRLCDGITEMPSLSNPKDVNLKSHIIDCLSTKKLCHCCNREEHIQAIHHLITQQFLRTGGVWLKEIQAILWGVRGFHYHIMQIKAIIFQIKIIFNEALIKGCNKDKDIEQEIKNCKHLILKTDYMMQRYIQPKYNVVCNQMTNIEATYLWSKKVVTTQKNLKSLMFIKSSCRKAIKDVHNLIYDFSKLEDLASLAFHLFISIESDFRHILTDDHRFMILIKDCFDSSNVDILDDSQRSLCCCS